MPQRCHTAGNASRIRRCAAVVSTQPKQCHSPNEKLYFWPSLDLRLTSVFLASSISAMKLTVQGTRHGQRRFITHMVSTEQPGSTPARQALSVHIRASSRTHRDLFFSSILLRGRNRHTTLMLLRVDDRFPPLGVDIAHGSPPRAKPPKRHGVWQSLGPSDTDAANPRCASKCVLECATQCDGSLSRQRIITEKSWSDHRCGAFPIFQSRARRCRP